MAVERRPIAKRDPRAVRGLKPSAIWTVVEGDVRSLVVNGAKSVGASGQRFASEELL